MMPREVCIDGGPPVTFNVVGFKDRKNAHRHLFKHVVRICDLNNDQLKSRNDTEDWNEVISDPPLAKSLQKRRIEAREALADVHGCWLNQQKRNLASCCVSCYDARVISEVDDKFAALLSKYENIAAQVFEWGFANPSQRYPRVLAFRDEDGKSIRIKAMDNRRFNAVGILDEKTGEVNLVTCFRDDDKESLKKSCYQLDKERAGNMQQGIHVDIETCSDMR